MKIPVVRRLVSYNLASLSLCRPPVLARSESLLLLALHAVGLLVLAQLARVPLWVVAGAVLILTLGSVLPRAREIVSPALLAPFWFVYAALAIRFAWIRLAGGDVPGYFEYALPDMRVLLRFEFLAGAAILNGALIALALLLSRGRALRFAAAASAGVVCLWAGAEYFGHRTSGVTGSDPYAYVQMAIDLVRRGSFAHRFELFPLISSGQLEWFPLLHVGYRLPYNASGDAITVWSPGGSVAFALAYAMGGEGGLYVVNPLFSLAGAPVSALLAWELARFETYTRRVVISSAAAALLLTSPEIVNWAGVTMTDTQALVLTTLAFYAALRVYRGGAWHWALLAGVFWGAAYCVRHTQLVIGFGLLLLVFLSPARFRNLAFLCGAAFLMALPDLWYHHIYLGNWLEPESQELALFSFNAILPTLAAVGQSAFAAAEFGWLVLFALLGIWFYMRRARVENFALLLWLSATLVLQLPYAALRLRDLIPQFPIIAFYVAFGVVATIGALEARQSLLASAGAACVIFLALALSVARVWNTLPRVYQPAPQRFGAMTQQQRASFDAIGQLTPANAVIGASLNSGALDLYARRSSFRPADWCSDARCKPLEEFLSVTQREGRAVYILEDDAALEPVLDQLRKTHDIALVAELDVPLFGDAPVIHPGALWKISK